MFYAVIDTNVLVSAALAKYAEASIPYQVVNLAFDGFYIPLYNDSIIKEYKEVLARPKFNLDKMRREILVEELVAVGQNIDAPASGVILPDPKDIMFYDVTLFAQDRSASLVTGNIKHFPCCPFVVTPRQFLELLLKHGLEN